MKILLLTRFLSTGVGGADYVGALIAELLAKNGHQVWVITNKMEGIKTLEHENIHTVFVSSRKPYPEGTLLKKTEPFSYNLYAIRAGLSIIKNEKIDIIHSNQSFGTYAMFGGAVLSLLTGTPHIKLFHHFASVDEGIRQKVLRQMGNGRSKAFVRTMLEKFSVKLYCSAVHTVSEATKDDLIKLGVKKPIFVIPNAISIPDEIQHNKINQHQLIHISRLELYKNVDVVIKALKIVKKTFPDVLLIMVGDGPYRKHLEELVSDLDLGKNVIFKKHISNKEKEKLLSTSEALVFPSFFEGFGLVILEAFAQNRPVLVSDVRPLSDIVENGKTGLIISPYDEMKWAQGIEKIFQDTENTSKMGKNGRKVLEEKYTLDKLYENLTKMYNEVLEKLRK